MRVLQTAAALAVILAFAALQAAATVAVRSAAAPGAWVSFVPQSLEARIVHGAGTAFAIPPTLRVVLARAALANGDEGAAEAASARLPAGVERSELAAEVLERRGDLAGAADAYLRAGDVAEIERRIDVLAARGDALDGLALARAAVVRMTGDRVHAASLADAWWEVGRSEQLTSYLVYGHDPQAQRGAMTRALAAYLKALALAPLSAKYLLSAGAEEQNLGDLAEAQTYYARAQAQDPASPDAYASLGEIALARGDRASAQALLARARRLDPTSDAADRLARKLAQ